MSNLIFFLSVLFFATARGDHPIWLSEIEELEVFSEDVSRNADLNYRLPENVIPLEYDIYIDLYFAERADRPFSFDGKVYITIRAVEENVNQVVLHANVDSINTVTLLTDDNLPVRLNAQDPFTLEPQFHFLKINLEETMQSFRNYTLVIEYSNTMNEGPMKRGLWRGWYTDANGVERIYAATHFQPYNARQAFPCWDEPFFKAVFKIHLTRPVNYSGTFSNTGVQGINLYGNRIRDNFYPTPVMSSYLVTFLVSETFQVIAENKTFSPPVRIIGRSNTNGLANRSLEFAVRMTTFFDDYFDMPYSSLDPHLLNDHISSPDWASAGTENWGMVSYRELYLILDPRETIMSVEHYATTLVSHELAHKWFGNLITCFWWSNTWINEGFASYFGYIAAHEMFPEYELHEHFNSRYTQTSLAFDSGTSTVPMNHDVNTPAQVTGHFGTISYSKGAAFLRMTVNMITPATFRKACQYFLRKNAYAPTDQHDLFSAFEEATREDGTLNEYQNFNFPEYYRVWVNEPGYPILKVEVDHSTGKLSLYQERFFLSASATPTGHIYPIPITFSTKSNPTFTNLKPIFMMTSETASLSKPPGEEWVIFNNLQHSHYRVDYDTKTWNLIGEALLNEPETIHYLNRAQERFFLSASATPTGHIYPIPITFSTKSNPTFTNLKPIFMMTSETASLSKPPGEEWVIFNNLQHSHYRVDYDTKTWNLIGEALLNEPETIHYLNRAQVVDDVFALMRSERMTHDFGFKILRFLRHETNYHVWNSAISGYSWLRNRLRHLPDKQAQFDSFIMSYMETVIQHVGYDTVANENPTFSMTRQEVMHFACSLGHEGCVQAYKERFARMKNGEWIDPRIRRSVYVVGIREGNGEDFDFLLDRFMKSNYANDQLEMLRGLGATKDPVLLNRYMELTLNKMVRSHDKANSFNYALLGNQENANTVLQYVKNRIGEIRVAYVEDAPANPVHTAMSNLASYLDKAGLAEYEAWLRSTQTDSAQFNSAISSINSARSNMAWGDANANSIISAARAGATHLIVSSTLMTLLTLLVVTA